jgi:membrane protease subunit HflC
MKTTAGLVIAIVLALLLVLSAFVVNEWEQVVITQFGRPVGEPIIAPGLKMRVPLIQTIHRFDRRFLEWSGEAEELPTRDKVFIWVDVYARWRISDPLQFLENLRDEQRAQSVLDDIIDGETRNVVANHDLRQVVRSTNREPVLDQSLGEVESTLLPIQIGRDDIRRAILKAAQAKSAELGIEILDVRFRRINYGESVQPNVYNRMISERRRIADRFRSEGQGDAARILGEMDRELKRIQSEAYRDAQTIMGKADGEATRIYAGAYDQSADSRKFYEFQKTMETFISTVGADTSLILSTDGEFYRYLKSSQ